MDPGEKAGTLDATLWKVPGTHASYIKIFNAVSFP